MIDTELELIATQQTNPPSIDHPPTTAPAVLELLGHSDGVHRQLREASWKSAEVAITARTLNHQYDQDRARQGLGVYQGQASRGERNPAGV